MSILVNSFTALSSNFDTNTATSFNLTYLKNYAGLDGLFINVRLSIVA